jgi:prepilin-type N-terminal cleavage/methylation domain-containing protein
MTRARGERGFTLIEVAIAMAILGIGVVTAIELFSGALKMEHSSTVRAKAVVRARSLLDATMTQAELGPGNDAGQWEDGYRWERAVREAPEYLDEPQRDDPDAESDLAMLEIAVSVVWPQSVWREGVYTVRTLRLMPRVLR